MLFTALLLVVSSTAIAEESDWRTSWDGTLYVYGNSMVLRDDSVLNPYNQIARLPQRSDVAELRFGFKAENWELSKAIAKRAIEDYRRRNPTLPTPRLKRAQQTDDVCSL